MRKNSQILQSDWSAIQNWIVFLLRRFGFIKLCIQYVHIWDLYQIKFHSCFFCWLTPFGATWKLTECSKYSLYKDPTYTGKRACLMPFFVNALFCSKIRRYDCHVFIPEMIPNYAWSPLHLFFVTRTSLGLIWDKCGWRTVGFGLFLHLKYYLNITLKSC